jgi:transcription elongation factor Elf1
MYTCPVCSMDLNRLIADVLRKTDKSRFECPMCGADLVATAVRVITIKRDVKDA